MRRALRGTALLAVLTPLALGAVACGQDDNGDAGRPVVSIFGPYRDREAELFTADLDRWGDEHGIDVRYTGSGNFAGDLEYRAAFADLPDIALVPQPGLVASLYRSGQLRPLPDEAAAAAEAGLTERALGFGRVDGDLVGLPFRVNVKSLVWYRPAELDALGLDPPTTLDELETMVQAIEDEGITPWCFGIGAEGSTGWAATDWVEELIVRQWGPDVYEQWVTGEVPFADDRIAASFDRFHDLVLRTGRVAGGVSGVVGTSVQDANGPLFTDPPGCVLYHQAAFALSWMPDGTDVGPDGDVDFFVLPGETASEPPLLASGDLAVAFADRPEVAEVLAYLATPDAVASWIAAGGFVSPLTGVAADAYPQPADRQVVERIRAGAPLVFDGSDAMPPDIGTRLFWDEITAWVAQTTAYDELATTLDGARDQLEGDASAPG